MTTPRLRGKKKREHYKDRICLTCGRVYSVEDRMGKSGSLPLYEPAE